jgi:caa(3)-type oxidase subunit IV
MSHAQSRQTLIVWYWLMALLILSVGASFVLAKAQALLVIFTIAVIKALLVARNYMHLKHEKAIIYAIAIVPVAFVIIFLIGLFPDFVYHTTKP